MCSIITDNDLISDIKKCFDKLGKIPSMSEYEIYGHYSCKAFKNHFGSWNKAMKLIFGFVNQEGFPGFKINCSQCEKEVYRLPSSKKKNKSGRYFCSHYCSAKYNSCRKKTGTRRSKLEKWIEEKLTEKYPNLEIHFNRKDAIISELDIYIPSIKLAFELNGIFHYEPIYGKEKLTSVQNNDKRKFQACLEYGIEFCTIDTSSFGYFKEEKAKVFLNIITDILDTKLKLTQGLKP